MKDYLKFLKRLPKPLRKKLIDAVRKIEKNQLKTLDVKALSTYHQFYRVRVGKLRILFQRRGDKNYITDLGFRGDIYK